MDQQGRLLGRLLKIISETLEFRHSQARNHLIGLPTDDGMSLVFFGDPIAAARCATEIGRALSGYPEMKLRMGIHTGPVNRIKGIDGRINVAGEGIKISQQITSLGDAGHILVSRPVADTLRQQGNWSKCLTDLGERELSRGARLQLFNLYTGEVGNPEPPGELQAAHHSRAAAVPVAAAALFASAGSAVHVAAPAEKKKVRPLFIIAVSVFVLAAVVAGYLLLKPDPAPSKPLLTTEFAENFTSLDRWKAPPSGWTFANQSLTIENQPIVGYPADVNCGDFTMTFQLKLVNDGGAAWALRVKDPYNYYLFYLSGPGGTHPNMFLTYLVQDGKPVQRQATSVIVRLVAGGHYEINIEAKNDLISQTIRTAQIDDEDAGFDKTLGLYRDNTYPTGSIGFLTYASEKFVVGGLYVRPPGVQGPD